ncbi:MAG: aspartate aminotransferase family protein [Anaerolineae bacterium]
MRTRTLSEQMLARSRRSLAGGVSSNVRAGKLPPPLFFARGQGSILYDVDGNRYVDYALGQGPLILGHSSAPVLEAVRKALERGQLYAGQHEMEIALSEELQSLIPCAELVRYSSTGSEVVQTALRVARAHTGREKFIKFEGHYHGWFDNVLVSVHPSLEAAGPREAPDPVPGSAGQVRSALGDVIVLPWNDLAVLEETLAARGDEVAAVIMEPIMCNTGCILPKAGYLEGVQKACRKHGVVLIFDEIITGFRVGLGGAQGYFGVTPDLATFGKAMGGGFPISCLAGRRELMEWIADGRVNHSGTFNSNIVAMAAALATLSVLKEEGVYERLTSLGRRLRDGLAQMLKEMGVVAQVEGPGPMFHLGFTDGQPVQDYRAYVRHVDGEMGHRFADLLMDEGVRYIPRGMWYLSTAHSEEDVEFTLEAARAVVRRLQA